jgi:hypothetical protein
MKGVKERNTEGDETNMEGVEEDSKEMEELPSVSDEGRIREARRDSLVRSSSEMGETTTSEDMRQQRIGFEEMAKEVGKKWKIDPETLVEYKRRATEEKERYKAELALYVEKQPIGSEVTRKQPESKVSEETKRISHASGEG